MRALSSLVTRRSADLTAPWIRATNDQSDNSVNKTNLPGLVKGNLENIAACGASPSRAPQRFGTGWMQPIQVGD
jgi:hypothetical protein